MKIGSFCKVPNLGLTGLPPSGGDSPQTYRNFFDHTQPPFLHTYKKSVTVLHLNAALAWPTAPNYRYLVDVQKLFHLLAP